jgi:hypothetical protein
VKILENVYEMLCESITIYGIEIWGIDGRWKETDRIYSRLCKINK